MMKKITAILLAGLLMTAGLGSCSGAADNEQNEAGKAETVSVVTTIFPVYDWVRNIAGADNADAYKANAAAYREKLAALDTEYVKAVEEGSSRRLVCTGRCYYYIE